MSKRYRLECTVEVEDDAIEMPALMDLVFENPLLNAEAVEITEMTCTEEEILAFCRPRLGSFERPRSVEFLHELPRTATGKVLRRVLREPYWAGQDRRVGGV